MRARTEEIQREIVRALDDDAVLATVVSNLEKLPRFVFLVTDIKALRVILEKFDGVVQSPSILLDITKLLVHEEYLFAKKLIHDDIAKILRALLTTLQHKAARNELNKKHLERAKMLIEAIFSAVLKEWKG